MTEFLQYGFFQRALIASLLGGATCGIVGVWVILLNIPFVGIAMSHSAFAGAVFGLLFGVNPLFSAVFFCLAAAFVIGPVADRGGFSPNISVGIIFSFVLGLAFLGIGFMKGPKTDALNFLWGNILTVSPRDVWLLAGVTCLIIVFLAVLYKEILAVLVNREIAKAVGVPEKTILYLLLFICGLTVTLNLNTIGGLLIFSLIISSPLAARQIACRLGTMYVLSAAFGVISCLTGLLVSCRWNVPSGAVIVITSSLIFGACMLFSPKRRTVSHESTEVF